MYVIDHDHLKNFSIIYKNNIDSKICNYSVGKKTVYKIYNIMKNIAISQKKSNASASHYIPRFEIWYIVTQCYKSR